MKRFPSLLCFALFVIIASVTAAPSPDVGNVEAEIARLEMKRLDALLKGDVKALEALYADELVYIHANGRIDTKQGYLGMLSNGNMSYVSLRYDPPAKITVAGSDVAVVTGKANIEAKNKSGQVTRRILTTTTVYARTPKGWRVVSYQGTPVQ